MIITFTFGNIFSFKEKQTISFLPEGLKELKHHLYNPNRFDSKEEYLRSIAIFGHNSYGKSNLVKALSIFQGLIKSSFKQPDLVQAEPFLLNTESVKSPSFFEILMYVKDTKYRYGFEIKENQILSEWLFYATTGVRENYLFQRQGQEFLISKTWNKEIEGKLEFQAVPFAHSNVLLFSVLGAQDLPRVKDVIEKISEILIIDNVNDKLIEKAVSIYSNQDYADAISNFIKKADLGFTTIFDKIEKKLKDRLDLDKGFLNVLYENEIRKFELYTKHHIYNEKRVKVDEVYFEMLKKESDGSIKFFIISTFLVYAIKNQLLICIDELDSKLHNDLLELLVREFHSPEINSLGSQLIFTLHNTVILDRQMRRDQFIVIDKNKYGESYIKKLHTKETPIRIDSSMEKEYRKGNLGGVSKKLKQINLQGRLFE